MPYIGRDLNRGNYLKLDDISSSFNSSKTTFNLTVGGSAFTPGSAFSILVSVGGVIQEPESAYQVNDSEITFANAPTAQDSFFCIALGVSLGIGVPGNGTVNGPQLAKPFNYDGFFYLNDGTNRVGINSSSPTVALDVSGTIKGSTFSGPISNPSGISTFYDVRVTNNLTVEGTTTTLDTNLIGVDRVEVGANSNSIVGVAITQSGTADIVQLFDGSTQVVTVDDTGNVGIGSTQPLSSIKLDVVGKGRFSNDLIILNGKILTLLNPVNTANVKVNCDGGARLNVKSYDKSVIQAQENWGVRFFQGNEVERLAIEPTGGIVVGAGGTIKIPDKIMHRDDEDTAIRFPSDNTISFETAGTEKLEIDSGGQFIYYSVSTQAADFGTGAAGGAFHKYDLGTAGATIGYLGSANNLVTGGNVADFALRSQGNMIIASGGGTERLRIRSDGSVQIGNSPTNLAAIGAGPTLGINGAAPEITLRDTATNNPYAWIATNDAGSLTLAADQGNNANSSIIDFRVDGSEKVRIDSSGRVLIGTTSVGSANADNLIIATSGDTGMTIRSGNTSDSSIYFADPDHTGKGFIQYDHNTDSYKTIVNGTQAIHIDNDLRILLGKSSFGGMASGVVTYGNRGGLKKDALTVFNATASVAGRGAGVAVGGNTGVFGSFYGKKSGNDDSTDGGNVFLESIGYIDFITNGDISTAVTTAPQLRIDSSGRVMIGTTTEGFAEADDLTINSADHGGITIRTPTNKEGNIAFSDTTSGTGEYSGLIRYRHSNDDLGLWTGSSPRLLITSTGRVFIGETSVAGGANLVVGNGGAENFEFNCGNGNANYNGGVLEYIHRGDGNTRPNLNFYVNNTGQHKFWTAGSERLTIAANGNVGINESSPSSHLHVKMDGLSDNAYNFRTTYLSGNNASGYTASGITLTGTANNSSGDKHTTFINFNSRDPSLNGSHGAGAYIAMSNPDSQGSYGSGQLDFYIRSGSPYSFPNNPQAPSNYWMDPLFTIKSSGNIGVAGVTGTDFSLLDGMVINTGNGKAGLIINSSSSSHNAYLSFGYGSGSGTSHADQYSAYIGRVGDDTLILGAGNSLKVTIGTDGEVKCIGADDNKGFAVYTSATRKVAELIEHAADGELRLYTGESTPVLRSVITSYGNSYINAGGTNNFGVGTDSPEGKIHIVSNADPALKIEAKPVTADTGAKSRIYFQITQSNNQSARLAEIHSLAENGWGGGMAFNYKPRNGVPTNTTEEVFRFNHSANAACNARIVFDAYLQMGGYNNTNESFANLAVLFSARDMAGSTLVSGQSDTISGYARRRTTSESNGTFFFGPYGAFPCGDYTALFRLKVTDNSSTASFGHIDIIGSGISAEGRNKSPHTSTARLDLTPSDWTASGKYQYFAIDFSKSDNSANIETRYLSYNNSRGADVYLDHVLILPRLSHGVEGVSGMHDF